MTQSRSFTDDIPPRRTPREIADNLLTGKIGIKTAIKISHDRTLTGDSTFADLINALRFEEVIILIVATYDLVEGGLNPETQKRFLKNLSAYVTQMKDTGTYVGETSDVRHFQVALEQFDKNRPLRALVDSVLPKIRDGKPLNHLDRKDLSGAAQMMNNIANTLSMGDLSDDTSMDELTRVIHQRSILRLAKEVHDELNELNKQINGPSTHLG